MHGDNVVDGRVYMETAIDIVMGTTSLELLYLVLYKECAAGRSG